MVLKEILNDDEYALVMDRYTDSYLDSIPNDMFNKVYNYLKSKKVYFINDLIINYLDIFTLDVRTINEAFNILEGQYGKEYIYFIGDNLNFLENTIIGILER